MRFGGSSQKDFVPCPEGDHPAVLVDMIDLGLVEQTFNGKTKKVERVRFVFEVHPRAETETYLVFQTYTKSLHEKATFRKHLKGWRGRDLNEKEEKEGYDVDILLNKPCLLTVSHNENDGSIFANIDLIRPLKGETCEPAGTYVRPAKYGPQPYPHLKEQAPRREPARPQPSPAQGFKSEPATLEEPQF